MGAAEGAGKSRVWSGGRVLERRGFGRGDVGIYPSPLVGEGGSRRLTDEGFVPTPRSLRQAMTPAERAIWTLLRGRGFRGLKFRRQEKIGPWIADFCCYELRLVIELDGGVHRLREDRDAARDDDLRRRGFSVLRFPNEPVLRNPNLVLEAIADHADALPPHPSGFA